MTKYLQPLKLFSLVLAGVGFLVAQELHKRELEEAVDKVLEKREAKKTAE